MDAPFDYSRPDGPRIRIFYRLIPAHGSTPGDSTYPIIVVINGGPGYPSSAYRPLDYDYANPGSPKNGSLDRFKYLLQSYRVLLTDQRGTDGNSAPLDMEDPSIDADEIARRFSSDSQARDHLAVIEAVVPKDEPFFLIAQSYGGMVGMQYLSLTRAGARRPTGIVFSASALPYEGVLASSVASRTEQLKLNLRLREAIPDIEARLAKVRERLKSLELIPDQVNGLYGFLGKGVDGVWQKGFAAHLETMLGQTRETIVQQNKDNSGEVNLLNYILSSANFTPGETDRTIARRTSELVPYEPWMIDENWVIAQAGGGIPWREAFVTAMDQSPPPPTPFVSVPDLRAAIAKFEVPGHTRIQRLPGGHSAIFLEDGHRAFRAWAASL